MKENPEEKMNMREKLAKMGSDEDPEPP